MSTKESFRELDFFIDDDGIVIGRPPANKENYFSFSLRSKNGKTIEVSGDYVSNSRYSFNHIELKLCRPSTVLTFSRDWRDDEVERLSLVKQTSRESMLLDTYIINITLAQV